MDTWFAGKRKEINFGPHAEKKLKCLGYLENFFDSRGELRLIDHSDGHVCVGILEESETKLIEISMFWKSTENGIESWWKYEIQRLGVSEIESFWSTEELNLEGRI